MSAAGDFDKNKAKEALGKMRARRRQTAQQALPICLELCIETDKDGGRFVNLKRAIPLAWDIAERMEDYEQHLINNEDTENDRG